MMYTLKKYALFIFLLLINFSTWSSHALDALRDVQVGIKPKQLHAKQKAINHRSGLVLVLFYSSQCPHCQAFAPTIQTFAKTEHWMLEPITLDGKVLPGFEHVLPADEYMLQTVFQGREIHLPALFLADKNSQILMPVSYGNLTYQELSRRIAEIETTRQGAR